MELVWNTSTSVFFSKPCLFLVNAIIKLIIPDIYHNSSIDGHILVPEQNKCHTIQPYTLLRIKIYFLHNHEGTKQTQACFNLSSDEKVSGEKAESLKSS